MSGHHFNSNRRLNSTNAALTPGSITISLVASNYNTLVGTFNLPSTASGTVNAGMNYTIHSYFDALNTGVAGAGINGTFTTAPAPGALALIGFGLLVLGALPRRVK